MIEGKPKLLTEPQIVQLYQNMLWNLIIEFTVNFNIKSLVAYFLLIS